MAYSRRSYKGAPVINALSGTLAANATSINLATAMSGWSTSGTPFFIVIDPGTTKEEKICVIYNTSTNLTVVDPAATSGWTAAVAGRGCDDTTDRQHESGAIVYPVFTAIEASQANELVSKYTTNGDIVVHGSTGFKTVATGGSGNNNKVLVADSTVSDGGVKWGQVVETGIADNAVTNAKMADNSVGTAEIINSSVGIDELATAVINRLVPVGTIAMYGGASAPTGWLLCNGDAINASYTALIAIVGANTPDFKGRFPIGDNASLNLRDTGGSATILEANLPSHSHGSGTLSTSTAGSHSHSGGTGYAGIHQHDYYDTTVTQRAVFNPDLDLTDDVVSARSLAETSIPNEGDGTHFHTIGADGNHSHSVNSGSTGTAGSGTAYYPPYLVVNYIIKHD